MLIRSNWPKGPRNVHWFCPMNCLKKATTSTKYLSTERNSKADCRMVYERRKQSMPWMETDYSKHAYFRWKIKWRLEHLGELRIVGEAAPWGCGAVRLSAKWDVMSHWSFIVSNRIRINITRIMTSIRICIILVLYITYNVIRANRSLLWDYCDWLFSLYISAYWHLIC